MYELIIEYLQNLPGEWHNAVLFFFCLGAIFFLWIRFGLWGLVAYISVASVACNIQILKMGTFSWTEKPIALGTIVFCSIFFVSDLIIEFYGAKKAKRIVQLSLAIMTLFTVWMFLTVAHPAENSDQNQSVQSAMILLFLPAPALTGSSLFAYLISLYADVIVFNGLSRLCNGRMLWLRAGMASLISHGLDTVIFNFMAWVIFSAQPMDQKVFWETYIIGTYMLRVMLMTCSIPFMYMARKLYPYCARLG